MTQNEVRDGRQDFARRKHNADNCWLDLTIFLRARPRRGLCHDDEQGL